MRISMSKASKQAVLNSSVEMIREYYEKEHKNKVWNNCYAYYTYCISNPVIRCQQF